MPESPSDDTVEDGRTSDPLEAHVRYLIDLACSSYKSVRAQGRDMLVEFVETHQGRFTDVLLSLPETAGDPCCQRYVAEIGHTLAGCGRLPDSPPLEGETVTALNALAEEEPRLQRTIATILNGRKINGEPSGAAPTARSLDASLDSARESDSGKGIDAAH